MNQLNPDSCLKIIIPISDSEELFRYQRGLINLLSKVEIGDCNPEVRDDVKSVYRLLSHLVDNKNSILNDSPFLNDIENHSVMT